MEIFNWANIITSLRILLIPLFIALMLSTHPLSTQLSAGMFLFLSFTDFLDGYLARKKNMTTDLGKILDPIADKLLIGSALILLLGKGVTWWIFFAIMIREILITVIRLYVMRRKLIIAASPLGKIKTILQIAAISATILGLPYSYLLLLIATAITLASGAHYLFEIKKLTGNEIVNIPNSITLFRLLLIIPFIFLSIAKENVLAFLCFGLIVALDRLDGVFARYANQTTKIGEMLDSFTDWVVLLIAFIIGATLGYLAKLPSILLFIAILLFALSKILYVRKKKDTQSTPLGKITVGLAYSTALITLLSLPFAWVLLWLLLASSYITVIAFIYRSYFGTIRSSLP